LNSTAASEKIYRILTKIFWDNEARSAIPPYVHTASKQCALNQSSSEVVLVNAPSGDYIFTVSTKNQQDTSWKYQNEGFDLLHDISWIIWNFFGPDLPFSTIEGAEVYH
jgi:beta-lactamase class A